MNEIAVDGAITLEVHEQGALWSVLLNAPRGNVLDEVMVRGLSEVFARADQEKDLKVLVLEGSGDHFSFGASVQEHLPDRAAAMLATFHGMFRLALETSVPMLAVVRGRCLGGGLELAAFANRVFGSPTCKLGQPEITLGVFAPLASLLLSDRVGRGHAEDLLLSGRLVESSEALAMGLLDEVADDPHEAALSYAARHLLPHSASSLRFATCAARTTLRMNLEQVLPQLENLYLGGLMATEDAREGLVSFLQKRPPVWSNA